MNNVSQFAWGVNLILLYVVISILAGTATFAITDSLGAGQNYPTRWAVVVAVLWPVLVIGLAQLIVLVTVQRADLSRL